MSNLEIEVAGYVSEILCGQIPIECKEVFTRWIQQNKNQDEIPEWLRKRDPNYVSQDEIKRIWYSENDRMRRIMRDCGLDWSTYKALKGLCHRTGFGSGKGDIGLFEIRVLVDRELLVEFVPFEPPEDTGRRFQPMNRLTMSWDNPEPPPCPGEGYVAVSAGSWAKGSMIFSSEIGGAFEKDHLEIVLVDLTHLGVGEDHFVGGIKYCGEALTSTLVKKTDEEMYQVAWYCPKRGKWLGLNVS